MSTERRIEITTVSAGSDDCNDGRTCPGVHTVTDRPGVYYVIVTEPPHRRPSAMTRLDEAGLVAFIDAHYKSAGDHLFRMERLPLYAVPHQTAELERWLAGETEPDWTTKQPWLDSLADERRRGLVSQRVRRFGAQLTDDELQACHSGYALNGEFEEIRVLRAGEHHIPPELMALDYWLVADTYAVPMFYDTEGHFLGAEVAPADRLAEFQHDRDLARAIAEPFDVWWAKHPELHRHRVA